MRFGAYNPRAMKNEKPLGLAERPRELLTRSPVGPSLNRLLNLGVAVVMFAIFSIFAKNFFTVRSALNLLLQTSTFAILSIGSTLVLIVGGIDFSLGAVIALSGGSVVAFAGMGMPIWLAMIAAICMGGIIGLANGFLVARLRLPSFITTFAMATLVYGLLGLAASHARPANVPESLGVLANVPVFRTFSHDATGTRIVVFPGVSWIVIIMVAVAVIFHLVLTKTRIGRYMYLVGSNQVASRFSGIKVVRVRIMAFVLASLLAGLVGVLLASRIVGPPGAAAGYEITGIICAMIGGASLLGGAGSVGGTVIGAFILSTLSMGLTMMNTNNVYIPMFLNGFVVLGAVYLDQVRIRK
jgi:ribose transport system permease protein